MPSQCHTAAGLAARNKAVSETTVNACHARVSSHNVVPRSAGVSRPANGRLAITVSGQFLRFYRCYCWQYRWQSSIPAMPGRVAKVVAWHGLARQGQRLLPAVNAGISNTAPAVGTRQWVVALRRQPLPQFVLGHKPVQWVNCHNAHVQCPANRRLRSRLPSGWGTACRSRLATSVHHSPHRANRVWVYLAGSLSSVAITVFSPYLSITITVTFCQGTTVVTATSRTWVAQIRLLSCFGLRPFFTNG